jgi:hypothetical protein
VEYRNSGIITKDDTTAEYLDSSNRIDYIITVNEAGYAYKNAGQAYEPGATRPMLTVTDRIPNNVNLSGSISCANASNVTVNDCVFDYNSETRVLTVQLPDGYARKIRYSVVVANPILKERSEYVNTAILNLGTKEFESTVGKEHVTYNMPSYTVENGTMRIKKVNAANINETVSGAKFRLTQVEYDAQGNLGAETVIDLNGASEGTDGATSSAGAIKFENLCGYSTGSPVAPCSNGGQLYYWQEVSVPAPYIPVGSMTKHYFMLYDEVSIVEDTQANRAVAEDAANIIMGNGNNDITVEVLKSNYEWLVSNTRLL